MCLGFDWNRTTSIREKPIQRPPFSVTRSSAQGNCSAKSLPGNVADSSLSSLSSERRGVWGQGGLGAGGVRGQGIREGRGLGRQGTFHPPCHVLHYHMVLRPEGTSHNDDPLFTTVSSAAGRKSFPSRCWIQHNSILWRPEHLQGNRSIRTAGRKR